VRVKAHMDLCFTLISGCIILNNALEETDRKWPQESAISYPSICLERLKITTKKFSEINRSPGRDLKQRSPAYEAELLTTRLGHLIPLCCMRIIEVRGVSVVHHDL
jgi:hypothetical protein